MSKDAPFLQPNTSPVPNALFELLPAMSEAELKVTLYLVRQTYGWFREWSETGYSTMDKICEATGLSDNSARTGIKAAMDRGTTERKPDGKSFQYRILVAPDEVPNPSKSEGSRRRAGKASTANFEVSDPNPSNFEGSDFEGLNPAKSEGSAGSYKELINTGRNTTPADAGGARGRAAAPAAARKAPADIAPHLALFGDLCHAAGLDSAALTKGTREQLGKTAAWLAGKPEADRPDRDALRGIYQAEHAALSARLGRDVDALTVQQFRQAIGRWITSRQQEAEDRQRRAELALREAEDSARWLKAREQARAEAAAPRASSGPAASSQRAAELWQGITGQLRPTMSPATWGQWLASTRGVEIDDSGHLVVEVATRYAEDWITQRLGGALRPLVEAAGLTDLRLVAADAAEERAA